MKIRGRRVALLLMGVLPLLAKDDVPDVNSDDMSGENDNDVQPHQDAAEKMHDDALTSIPSLRFVDLTSPSVPTNFVMVDEMFDYQLGFSEVNSSNAIETSIQQSQIESKHSLGIENAEAVKEEMEDGEVGLSDAEKQGEMEQVVDDPPYKDNEKVEIVESQEEGKPTTSEGEDEEEGTAKRVMVDYANKSAGALILERSPSMKGASNLLTNDKDKYAISPCKDKKFVVVGLSEDILVKQIKIANYELYSSHVKDFQVLGSQTMGQWVDLGTFMANHGIGEQSFELPEPSWARYLKFRFISHHRDEHFCTLSQIQVHGSTMLQGFREQWKEGEEKEQEREHDGHQEAHDESSDNDSVLNSIQQNAETDAADDNIKEHKNAVTNSENTDDMAKNEASTKSANADGRENPSDKSDPSVVKGQVGQRMTGTTNPEDKLNKLPILPPIFDIQSVAIPNALEFVWFDLPAKRIVNANSPQRAKSLRVKAISSELLCHGLGSAVQRAVKAVVAEASDTVQKVHMSSSMTSAVRGLQHKIQTTIGRTWELHHTIQTMIGKALPGMKPDWDPEVHATVENSMDSEILVNSTETLPTDQTENVTQQNATPTLEPGIEDVAPITVVETAENAKIVSRNPATEDTTLDVEMSQGLAKVISRYPSAKCLESLHFPAFKKNIMAKATSKATAGNGSTNNPGGKMEPIFKTLTDEIKTLQISQNVHDQFSRALITCYQSIMIEMASDLHATRTLQEDRIANLEAEMKRMHSPSWMSCIPSGFVHSLSFTVSLLIVAYAQSSQLVKEIIFQLYQLPGGPPILGLLGLLVAATVAVSLRRRSKKRRDIPNPKRDLWLSSAMELPPRAIGPFQNSTCAIPLSQNGRIPKSRSLQLFPSE